jgi:hypothetical protein
MFQARTLTLVPVALAAAALFTLAGPAHADAFSDAAKAKVAKK